MKNFSVEHMEANGSSKKTEERKKTDEQLQMKFAAMEDERHEKLSAEAKAEFEKKTDAEKQEFMNSINDVENKPLTYDVVQALKEHKDITFYCIASTGLNTEDKTKTIKGANGYEKRHIIKDEPTLFKADTYTFDADKGAYMPKDSVSVFIEASKEVVDRAIQSAEAGGYDVFANADFNLPEYLAGRDVKSKDDAKAIIAKCFENASGIVLCYGEFHENMLRGNDFPIPADSIDLNRVMGEQGTFGTASLNKCINQILKTTKDNALELKSTSEKLIADVICLNKIASLEMDEPVKFLVNEEVIDKFSDKDRGTILDNEENNIEVMPRMRRRAAMGADRESIRTRRVREGVDDARESSRHIPSKERTADNNDKSSESTPNGFVRRVPKGDAKLSKPAKTQLPEGYQPANPFSFFDTVEETDIPEISTEEIEAVISEKAEKAETEKTNKTPEKDFVDDFDDFFSDQIAEQKKETKPKTKKEAKTVETVKTGSDASSEPQSKDEIVMPELNLSRENKEALQSAGLNFLIQAIMQQNELLKERNTLSMKQNEIESQKVAEMQRQSELIEQQTKQMEKLTMLMDNLTKVYSRADVENLRMDAPIVPKTEPAVQAMPLRQAGPMPMRQRTPGASFVRRTPRESVAEEREGSIERQMASHKEEISRMNGDTKQLLASLTENAESQEIDIDAPEKERRMHRNIKKKEDDIVELP